MSSSLNHQRKMAWLRSSLVQSFQTIASIPSFYSIRSLFNNPPSPSELFVRSLEFLFILYCIMDALPNSWCTSSSYSPPPITIYSSLQLIPSSLQPQSPSLAEMPLGYEFPGLVVTDDGTR